MTEGAEDHAEVALEPVLVRVVGGESHSQAAHYGSFNQFAVPLAGNPPVQLLQYRPTRSQAIIYNPAEISGQSQATNGSVAAPGTSANLVQITGLTPGAWYNVNVSLNITGTTGTPENTFARLLVGPVVIPVPIQGPGLSNSPTYLVKVPGTTLTLTSANQPATAGSVWDATMAVTPATTVSNPILISQGPAQLQLTTPQGFSLDNGMSLKMESRQALYAIMPAGATVPGTICVLDESWDSKET